MMYDEEYFRSRSEEVPGGCWEWSLSRFYDGYGRFNVLLGKSKTRSMGAHRGSFCAANGIMLPSDAVVMHTCDNRSCVNPRHLTLGTNKSNSEDMVAKGRSARGERQGSSKLTSFDVTDIKRMWADGYLQKDIASLFGVSRSTVSEIISGKSWSHHGTEEM